MNAIDFLLKEHNHVRKTLAGISDNSHSIKTKRKMFQSLSQDLNRHETMEHQVWYPHFKNDHRLSAEVQHLLTEEKSAEKAIKQFDNIDLPQEWELKFSKLKHDVEHHAQEEEQDLFPEVKKLLSDDQLEQIGLKMYHFKRDYHSSTN